MKKTAATGIASLLVALAATAPTWAVIQVLIPLQALLKDSDLIFMATVTSVDTQRRTATLEVGEQLKGKAPFTRLPVNLKGDQENHTPQLLKRIAPDLPIVVCLKNESKDKSKEKWMALAFTNGTWFQLLGESDGERTRWAFTHCETYLRRTFKGTTGELRQTIVDALAGKKKAPPPNPKEPPGFGPELSP